MESDDGTWTKCTLKFKVENTEYKGSVEISPKLQYHETGAVKHNIGQKSE